MRIKGGRAVMQVRTASLTSEQKTTGFSIPVTVTGRCDRRSDGLVTAVEVNIAQSAYDSVMLWVDPNCLMEEGPYGGLLPIENETEQAVIDG